MKNGHTSGEALARAVSTAWLTVDGTGEPTRAAIKRLAKGTLGGNIVKAGNAKVGHDTACFNISTTWDKGTGFTCPEFLSGTCQLGVRQDNACYRARDAKMYPTIRDFDARSEKAFRTLPPDRLAAWILLLWYADAKPENIAQGIRFVRFNVGGGIRDNADMVKMVETSDELNRLAGLHSYTYTSRYDLAPSFPKVTERPHLTLTGSGFRIDNAFKVRPKGAIPVGSVICPGSCANCHICKFAHDVDVFIETH